MSADYNGWADRSEEEREGEEAAEQEYASAPARGDNNG